MKSGSQNKGAVLLHCFHFYVLKKRKKLESGNNIYGFSRTIRNSASGPIVLRLNIADATSLMYGVFGNPPSISPKSPFILLKSIPVSDNFIMLLASIKIGDKELKTTKKSIITR